MTLIQGMQLGQLAKAKGKAIRTEQGKVQVVSVTYNSNGKATVTEQSMWLTFEQALEMLK